MVKEIRPIDRIVAKAEASGWSLTDFARKMEVENVQVVQNWLKRGMPARHLPKAAQIFACKVDDLLRDENTRAQPPSEDELWALLRNHYDLDPQEEDDVREIFQDRVSRLKLKRQPKRKKKGHGNT